MKTTTKVLEFILEITFQAAIQIVLIIGLTSLAYCQSEKETKMFSFVNDREGAYELTSFTCKHVEGKVYVMWTVLEPLDHCIYRLERSLDNKTFNTIYAWSGFKSPNGLELLNSFVDKKPLKGISYYRIVRFEKDDCNVSSVIAIDNPEMYFDNSSAQNTYVEFVAEKNMEYFQ